MTDPNVPGTAGPPLNPPRPGSTLVTKNDQQQVFTIHRECDAHTAILRGAAEYLAQLDILVDGMSIRLDPVRVDWAETEEQDESYPSAGVYSDAEGTYSKTGLTPKLSRDTKVAEGTYLVQTGYLDLPFMIDVYCTSLQERSMVGAALEDALIAPNDWASGFRMVLPHYFGAHGGYTVDSVTYVDSPPEAKRRLHRLLFGMSGNVNVYRPQIKVPLLKPRVQGTVTYENITPTPAEPADGDRVPVVIE